MTLNARPDEAVLHIAGWWQHPLDMIGLKVPRALCGISLAGDPGDGPGPDAPVCPACAARSGMAA